MNLQLSETRFANRATTSVANREVFRRRVQLALAAMWLLDAVLQFQPYMFSKAFATNIIGSAAAGNPGIVAGPVTFAAGVIVHHPAVYNSLFASTQLLIAISLIRRRGAKLALGVSIGWALGVWWMGEGLGGILTGGTTVYMGAPGAALLYVFIAVYAWPRSSDAAPGSSLASTSPLRRIIPLLAWVALWASFVYYALQPAMRSAQALSAMMTGMAGGEPGWIRSMDMWLGRTLAGNGTQVSVALAVLFAVTAVAVVVPRAAKVGVLVAVALGAAVWVSQDFGAVFSGSATDPNTGLPLMVLAACYWPLTRRPQEAATSASVPIVTLGAERKVPSRAA